MGQDVTATQAGLILCACEGKCSGAGRAIGEQCRSDPEQRREGRAVGTNISESSVKGTSARS